MEKYHRDDDEPSNFNEALEKSFHMLKNLFLTGDMNKEFKYSDNPDDPYAGVKNQMKQSQLYLKYAFACFVLGAISSPFRILSSMGSSILGSIIGTLFYGIFGAVSLAGIIGCVYFLYKGITLRKASENAYNNDILSKAIS